MVVAPSRPSTANGRAAEPAIPVETEASAARTALIVTSAIASATRSESAVASTYAVVEPDSAS